MSLFKNFNKVLSQATLNNKRNAFLIRSPNALTNPALYYLNNGSDLRDPFNLALVSYHLVRKVQSDREIHKQLSQTGSSSQDSFTLKVLRDIKTNEELLNQYLHDLRLLLKLQKFDLPIAHLVQTLYSFENYNTSDFPFYEQYIFPLIKQKIQYASLHNLYQLTTILTQANYYEDKELWSAIVQRIEEKASAPHLREVKYSGWTLDTYELDERTPEKTPQTENERYFAGGIGFIGNLKAQYRDLMDYLCNRFWNRFVFTEPRIMSSADSFTEEIDEAKFNAALEEAGRNGIDTANAIRLLNKPKVNA